MSITANLKRFERENVNPRRTKFLLFASLQIAQNSLQFIKLLQLPLPLLGKADLTTPVKRLSQNNISNEQLYTIKQSNGKCKCK